MAQSHGSDPGFVESKETACPQALNAKEARHTIRIILVYSRPPAILSHGNYERLHISKKRHWGVEIIVATVCRHVRASAILRVARATLRAGTQRCVRSRSSQLDSAEYS
jgi:hypothetical protein